MRAASVLLCGVSLLVVGCKQELEYHRLELPGFSLEVPKQVRFDGDLKERYRAGQVQSVLGLQFVSVTWQVGTIATVDELPGLAKATAAVLPKGAAMAMQPARKERIGGNEATWLDASIGGEVDVTMVDIACGRRSVMIGIGAARGFEAMRSRILKSFRCTPVEADETAIASAVPIGVDDPTVLAGWHLVSNEEGYTISNGELIAVFPELANAPITADMLEKALPAMFAAYGGTWTPSRRERRPAVDGERDLHFGTMKIDEGSLPAVLSLWSCGGSMLMGMVMRTEGTDLESAADFLLKVRCARPGDPSLKLPPMPTEAEAGAGSSD